MEELLIVLILCSLKLYVCGIRLNLPKVIEAIEKDDITVSCNTTDYDGIMELVKFYWTKSAVIIQSEQTLKIEHIELDQSGNYTCHAIVEGNTYNSSVEIIVSYAPIWVKGSLRKFSGALGTSASLICSVSSFPSPTFAWLTPENVSASSDSKFFIEHNPQLSTLVIHSIARADYGTYVCNSANRAGKRSYNLELLVPGVPDGPQQCELNSANSDSVIFNCLEGYKGGVDDVDYLAKAYIPGRNQVPVNLMLKRVNSSILITINGLSPKQDYTMDIYTINAHGTCKEPLSMYFTTAPGLLTLTTGSPDSSKVIALAVCIPLLFIVIIVASLTVLRVCHNRIEDCHSSSEVVSFQHALNNFAASHHRPRSNSKEQILFSNNIIEASSNSFHNNPAFIDNEQNDRVQPSLAGCGALQTLQASHLAATQLRFVSGKSNFEVNERDAYAVKSLQPISDSWEFPRNKFYLKTKIGNGSYGEVWEARIENIEDGGKTVAVKMLRDNFTDDDKQSMLDDMDVMKLIKFHPNIIQLLGCCTSSYPLCVIMEYAPQGSLLNLLRQQKLSQGIAFSTKDIESFTLQIASAMEFITPLKIIHRDLATRSVLMSNDLVCKLSDFERVQHFQNGNMCTRKSHRIQIRWLPPESLFVMERSIKSNIWSFGVLVWECYTLGSTPYPGMTNKEVVDFVQRGGRMPKPNLCSQAVYEMMLDCWVYYPHKRTTFCDLRKKIERMYETNNAQKMDIEASIFDGKWNASPQDLGDFV